MEKIESIFKNVRAMQDAEATMDVPSQTVRMFSITDSNSTIFMRRFTKSQLRSIQFVCMPCYSFISPHRL